MRLPRVLFATTACAAMAMPAFSRFRFATQGSCDGTGAATINVSPPRVIEMEPATGAPYSASRFSDSVRTLADGSHLTRKAGQETATWRDSSGRVRTEIHASEEDAPCRSVLVQIEDPVAGYLYVLDPVNLIAHRLPFVSEKEPAQDRAVGQEPRTRPVQTEPGAPTFTSESLGAKTMFGVPATGTRTTETWPPGSRRGNDRPFTVTCEDWRSTRLPRAVYTRCSDPTGTVTTTALKDVSLAEPDASLLQVPAGYKVVDEAGPFTIGIPSHK